MRRAPSEATCRGAGVSSAPSSHCAATRVKFVPFAVLMFACGDVVAHETLPALFVHAYQVPVSLILTVVAFVGLIENVTLSMFCGEFELRT